jgi:hypothetical protein
MPHAPTIPLPEPLKQKIKDALVALSLANLLFLRPTFDLLFDDDRFFNRLLVTNHDLLALFANIFGAAALIWLGMRAVHRFRQPVIQLVLHLAFFSLLLIPADFVRAKFYSIPDYLVLAFFPAAGGDVVPGGRAGAGAVAAPAGGHSGRGVAGSHVGLRVRHCHKNRPVGAGCHSSPAMRIRDAAPLMAVRPGQPRVVWMIFDELDYRLVFEERTTGVALPEFDRWKRRRCMPRTPIRRATAPSFPCRRPSSACGRRRR